MTYAVNEVYPSIQGEGTLAGTPMIVVRLQGCDVGCPFCDTKQTWPAEAPHTTLSRGPATLLIDDLLALIGSARTGERWVMLTGGEPAAQDLRRLVELLHRSGLKVQIETSGTYPLDPESPFDWVTVSPKIAMPGGRPIIGGTLARADEIKHVVGRQEDIDALDTLLAYHHDHLSGDAQICLQPMSQSPKATRLAAQTVVARGWRLSVQTHKYIGLP